MQQPVNLTIQAESTAHFHSELAGLFWLAQVMTGDDNAAIELVLETSDFRPAARRTIIEAACGSLSSEIQTAAQEVSEKFSFSDVFRAQSVGATLDFETLCLALLEMNLLLRLVWVLRLAEGYSTMETAKLLHVEPLLVRKALPAAVISLASIFR